MMLAIFDHFSGLERCELVATRLGRVGYNLELEKLCECEEKKSQNEVF